MQKSKFGVGNPTFTNYFWDLGPTWDAWCQKPNIYKLFLGFWTHLGPLGEFRDALGDLWVPFGRSLGSFWEALGMPWDALGDHAKNRPQKGLWNYYFQEPKILPKRITVINFSMRPSRQMHSRTGLSFGPAPALEG